MFNRSGISATNYANVNQILANVEMQASVGCIVPQSMGVTVGAQKIVKAGTPIHINFANLQTAAVAVASGNAMNAVLLHDVDVTAGNANGTALIFGFVNLNRVESDVKTKITSAQAVAGASALLTFLTV